MPIFAVINNEGNMLVVVQGNKATWQIPPINGNLHRFFNTYTSKFQARRHLKELDNVPEDVKIVEVQTVEDK
jgi:hypothetical protein